MNIPHVGKVTFKDNVVTKHYEQNVSGSAYKKIAADIIFILEAGYTHINIELNADYTNKEDVEIQVRRMKQLVPFLKLTILEPIQNEHPWK